jgi:cold shock protein
VAQGTIRRLLEQRGFGFIQSEDGRSVFFHRSEVHHVPFWELQESQAVEFVVENTPQGRRRDRCASSRPPRSRPWTESVTYAQT